MHLTEINLLTEALAYDIILLEIKYPEIGNR